MCLLDRHHVNDVHQRYADEFADVYFERSVGQVAVKDVRCAKGKE